MTTLTDSGSIFSYHRAMIAKHGMDSILALGWRDEESQLSRFKILGAVADLNDCTVLDAGCGYADLLPYLLNLYPRLKSYCGIEQIPELLDEAAQRYSGYKNSVFTSGNFMTYRLPKADYVLVNGALNYTSTDPDFISNAIARLYQSCNYGLAFNLLQQVPAKGLLKAYDPDSIVAICNTLCDNVNLIVGYSEEDFTIYMYRNAA